MVDYSFVRTPVDIQLIEAYKGSKSKYFGMSHFNLKIRAHDGSCITVFSDISNIAEVRITEWRIRRGDEGSIIVIVACISYFSL